MSHLVSSAVRPRARRVRVGHNNPKENVDIFERAVCCAKSVLLGIRDGSIPVREHP